LYEVGELVGFEVFAESTPALQASRIGPAAVRGVAVPRRGATTGTAAARMLPAGAAAPYAAEQTDAASDVHHAPTGCQWPDDALSRRLRL
jgi:hypothetical protein